MCSCQYAALLVFFFVFAIMHLGRQLYRCQREKKDALGRTHTVFFIFLPLQRMADILRAHAMRTFTAFDLFSDHLADCTPFATSSTQLIESERRKPLSALYT
ncbi:MAG: hypothetical protein ACYS14_15130, partial [Planctomycetota bacterium]